MPQVDTSLACTRPTPGPTSNPVARGSASKTRLSLSSPGTDLKPWREGLQSPCRPVRPRGPRCLAFIPKCTKLLGALAGGGTLSRGPRPRSRKCQLAPCLAERHMWPGRVEAARDSDKSRAAFSGLLSGRAAAQVGGQSNELRLLLCHDLVEGRGRSASRFGLARSAQRKHSGWSWHIISRLLRRGQNNPERWACLAERHMWPRRGEAARDLGSRTASRGLLCGRATARLHGRAVQRTSDPAL